MVPLVLFEVYQGEVFKQESADFAAVDDALSWVSVIETTRDIARAAGELQNELRARGTPLSARDAFIAGAAYARGERLVVTDSDFDVSGIEDFLVVEHL